MIQRIVNPSKSNSFFLFGARGTGKSTFVTQQFLGNTRSNVFRVNLLEPDIEDKYARAPEILLREIKAQKKKPDWVFIDEVQKNPRLLDLVHLSIEELGVKFILTGSSSRKLKRGGANLLAGRAFLYSMYPFVFKEIQNQFQLNQVLRWGTLPKVTTLEAVSDKISYLRSYGQIYLKEEIKAEQLIRNIDPFRSFLEIAAQMSGKIINYSRIGNDIGVDSKTVQNYFEILSDTWIGFFIPSFHGSVRKSQRMSPKFFFFDLGVKNSLSQLLDYEPTPGNSLYGELFEHFLINEIFRLNDYLQKDFRLSYLSTKNNAEVDLILSHPTKHYALEIKSSSEINEIEVRKLKSLAEDIPKIKKIFYVSNHPQRRGVDGVLCLHWREFLEEEFGGL